MARKAARDQYRVMTSGPTAKFASHGGPAKAIKTKDVIFSGAYAAGVYTADTQPLQKFPINTTGAVQALNLVTLASGEAARLTNKIAMKSIRIRMSLDITGKAGPGISQPARILLVYHRNTNGTYPAASTILQDILDTNTISNGGFASNLSVSQFDNMVVLKDSYRMLPAASTSASNFQYTGETHEGATHIDWFVKLKDLETIFSGSASPPTIGQVQTGALYLVSLGAYAANNAGEYFQWNGVARLRFKDC